MRFKYFFVLLFFFIYSGNVYSNNLLKLGSTSEDFGKDLVVDLEGSTIITGFFNLSVNFNPDGQAQNFSSKGKTDMFLVKYNSEGQFVWGFSIGGIGDDAPNRVFADFMGNYYVVGYFSNTVDFDPSSRTVNKTSKGGKDVFLAKYDYDGAFQWVVTFGGPLDDEATDVFVDILANVYITGFFSGKIDMDSTDGEDSEDTFTSTNQNNDLFVASYNELGDYNLGFILGSTGNDRGTGIRATISGDIIVSGNFENTVDFDLMDNSYNLSSSGGSDFFIASYDFLNDLNFAFKFGGSGNDILSYGGMELDKKDNIILAGSFSGTVNFNPNGTANLTSIGKYDGFLAKYSSSGSYVWAFNIGSNGDDQVSRISVGLTNNIAVSGFFGGKADFDPSKTETYEITPKSTGNSTDGFIAYYSSEGKFTWANGHGTSGNTTYSNTSSGVYISNYDDIQATGRFYGTAEFYTRYEAKNLSSSGSSDIFLVKFDMGGRFKGTLQDPFLKLISPNGGEKWQAGDIQKIQWVSTNIDKIKIEYSTNNGLNWILVKDDVNAEDSNFDWTIPETPSTNCLVKISITTNSNIYDESDKIFEIFKIIKQELKLVQPNGGERWKAGDSHKIQWLSTNIDKIKIEYSTNSGSSWILIKDDVNAGDSNIDWTIPETPSANCLVKISNTASQIYDESDNLFEIYQVLPPHLSLIQPNGGEQLKPDNNYQIKWNFTGDNLRVKIYLSTDNGSTWSEISEEMDATLQSYIWLVPDIESEICKIRIKDVQTDGSLVDVQSQGTFRIAKELSVEYLCESFKIKTYFDNSLDALVIEGDNLSSNLKTISLYDINGNLINQYNDLNLLNSHTLPVGSLPSGIYLLSLDLFDKILNRKVCIVR